MHPATCVESSHHERPLFPYQRRASPPKQVTSQAAQAQHDISVLRRPHAPAPRLRACGPLQCRCPRCSRVAGATGRCRWTRPVRWGSRNQGFRDTRSSNQHLTLGIDDGIPPRSGAPWAACEEVHVPCCTTADTHCRHVFTFAACLLVLYDVTAAHAQLQAT